MDDLNQKGGGDPPNQRGRGRAPEHENGDAPVINHNGENGVAGAANAPHDENRAGQARRAPHLPGQSLRALLRRSPITDYLLTLLHLQNRDSFLIVRVIIDYLVQREGFTLNANHFRIWASEIVAIFRYERRATYFSSYEGGENGHAASGRLWDRYNNVRRLVRNRVQRVPNPARRAPRGARREPQHHLINRLHAVPLDDVARLRDLWEQTFPIRDRQANIAQYYAHFPQLRTPIGPSLLEIDYRLMNLSELDIIRRKWPVLAPKLLTLARRKASCRDLLTNRGNIPPEVLALKIFPYLFRTKQVVGGGCWRPSALEQANGFIQWLNNIGELDRAIADYQESMSVQNLTCQPIVYAIGPLNALLGAYVVIDGIRYRFATALSAVDSCFKAIFVLNASYPPECDHVWAFVERYIYELNVPRAPQEFVAVNHLISDLAALENQNLEN